MRFFLFASVFTLVASWDACPPDNNSTSSTNTTTVEAFTRIDIKAVSLEEMRYGSRQASSWYISPGSECCQCCWNNNLSPAEVFCPVVPYNDCDENRRYCEEEHDDKYRSKWLNCTQAQISQSVCDIDGYLDPYDYESEGNIVEYEVGTFWVNSASNVTDDEPTITINLNYTRLSEKMEGAGLEDLLDDYNCEKGGIAYAIYDKWLWNVRKEVEAFGSEDCSETYVGDLLEYNGEQIGDISAEYGRLEMQSNGYMMRAQAASAIINSALRWRSYNGSDLNNFAIVLSCGYDEDDEDSEDVAIYCTKLGIPASMSVIIPSSLGGLAVVGLMGYLFIKKKKGIKKKWASMTQSWFTGKDTNDRDSEMWSENIAPSHKYGSVGEQSCGTAGDSKFAFGAARRDTVERGANNYKGRNEHAGVTYNSLNTDCSAADMYDKPHATVLTNDTTFDDNEDVYEANDKPARRDTDILMSNGST